MPLTPMLFKDQLYPVSRINLSMATLTLENGRNEAEDKTLFLGGRNKAKVDKNKKNPEVKN